MPIATYDELAKDVRFSNGIKSYPMNEIRDVHGAGKLGTTVIQNISKELALKGLGHYGPLKLSQGDTVRIYDKGSAIGEIIEALNNVGEASDKFLQQVSDKKERSRIIERLKELISEL